MSIAQDNFIHRHNNLRLKTAL